MRRLDIIIFASVALAPTLASAQQRRTQAPPGGGTSTTSAPAGARMRGTASARFPFAGAWEGSVSMKDGPAREPTSIGMTFDVADTSKRSYAGFTIYPNNARAPHLNSLGSKDSLRWEQSNSGGGHWVYAARLVSPDSMVGTLTLHDAPWHPTTMPHGTFVMVRQQAATR